MTANRKKYNSHIFRWLMVNCCYFSFMNINICTSYQGHGWCSKGKKCPKSHAIDLILDLDGIKTAKNRQRRRKLAALKEQSGDRTSNGMDCKKFVDEEIATLHNSEEILKSDSYTKLVNCSLSMSDDVMEDGNSDEVKISNRSQYNDIFADEHSCDTCFSFPFSVTFDSCAIDLEPSSAVTVVISSLVTNKSRLDFVICPPIISDCH